MQKLTGKKGFYCLPWRSNCASNSWPHTLGGVRFTGFLASANSGSKPFGLAPGHGQRPESKPPEPEKQTQPKSPDKVTMVSTRPARCRSQVGSTNFATSKPVEPDRNEGAPRVETTPFEAG